MSFDEVCAILAVEPYNLSFAEIAELDDYQIANVLFRPRDDEGRPLSDEDIERARLVEAEAVPVIGYRELFRKIWLGRGLSEAEVEERWRQYREQYPE